MKPLTLPITESQFQRQIVNTLKKQCFFVFAVPNGGLREGRTGKTLCREGVMKGVSDLIIVLPNKVYFVEIKRMDGKGRQSPEQKLFEREVTHMGHTYLLWDNWKAVDDFILKHRKEALASIGN